MFDQGKEIMLPVGMEVRDLHGKKTKIPFDQMGKVISVAKESNDTAIVRGMYNLYVVKAEQLFVDERDFDGTETAKRPLTEPHPVLPTRAKPKTLKPLFEYSYRAPRAWSGDVDEDMWPSWTQRGRQDAIERAEVEEACHQATHPLWKTWLTRTAAWAIGGGLTWLFFSGRLVRAFWVTFGR